MPSLFLWRTVIGVWVDRISSGCSSELQEDKGLAQIHLVPVAVRASDLRGQARAPGIQGESSGGKHAYHVRVASDWSVCVISPRRQWWVHTQGVWLVVGSPVCPRWNTSLAFAPVCERLRWGLGGLNAMSLVYAGLGRSTGVSREEARGKLPLSEIQEPGERYRAGWDVLREGNAWKWDNSWRNGERFMEKQVFMKYSKIKTQGRLSEIKYFRPTFPQRTARVRVYLS